MPRAVWYALIGIIELVGSMQILYRNHDLGVVTGMSSEAFLIGMGTRAIVRPPAYVRPSKKSNGGAGA